jgi:hypothetical protein
MHISDQAFRVTAEVSQGLPRSPGSRQSLRQISPLLRTASGTLSNRL